MPRPNRSVATSILLLKLLNAWYLESLRKKVCLDYTFFLTTAPLSHAHTHIHTHGQTNMHFSTHTSSTKSNVPCMVYLPSNGLIETLGSTRNMHWSAQSAQLSILREREKIKRDWEMTKMLFNVVDGTYIMGVAAWVTHTVCATQPLSS